MEIRNIALVRATNVIPFDGIVRPISEVPYIQKESGNELTFEINQLLKRQGKLKEIDWTKVDEWENIGKENIRILEQYLPYNSSYNSMVLWSLNGLVPDDSNNTFSSKTCAIIDGLEEQIKQVEMISLVPTDTAIKGNVKLSKEATILINKKRFNNLTQEEKEKLSKLDLNVKIFEGELSEAIKYVLEESNRYTSEKLSLAPENRGYRESKTSNELIETIDKIAEENNIAQELHFSIFTWGSGIETEKLQNVENEWKNTKTVMDFYRKLFFDYLFSKMDINDSVKENIALYPNVEVYIKDLCNEIEKIGIEEYKRVLDKYNRAIERLKESGKLYTPQQIVDFTNKKEKIDLLELIEEETKKELEKESIDEDVIQGR